MSSKYDDLSGGLPDRKTTSHEDNRTEGRQSNRKGNFKKVEIRGRQKEKEKRLTSRQPPRKMT